MSVGILQQTDVYSFYNA